jgi:hypothetical protein
VNSLKNKIRRVRKETAPLDTSAKRKITAPDDMPQLLDEAETAKFLGVSQSFLRKSRSEGPHGHRTQAPLRL